jgi:hypothetical protein
MNAPYCSTSGRSRPRYCWTASRWAGVASMGRNVSSGFVTIRVTKNTALATRKTTTSPARSRFTTNFRIDATLLQCPPGFAPGRGRVPLPGLSWSSVRS